ncbi:MAG TPA: lactate racemase domain-containing protein [Candidatus Hydrogenedentes bacterium]|nr:lactate racemase domain-containing protein [Candidatus Hydrogenedentota bacterium]
MVKACVAPPGEWLSSDILRNFVHESLAEIRLENRRILFIIPDHTRSMPMPLMFRALCEATRKRAAKTDFLIALGTHPPMTDEMIQELLGITAAERAEVYGDIGIFNHAWKDPEALAEIGWLTAEQIEELSGELMREAVRVTVNRLVLQYDVVCIVGPVFPHEVVGFSGGNKYFFPGVAGEEILNMFHWLGALITNYAINGTKHTPVRAVVDRAAALIPVEKWCFCLTQVKKNTRAIFFGTPEAAWDKAADLSAETHIIYKDKPFRQVLAMAAPMYDELWVAGKCMYKLEPVVADGGELIIYGRHVKEVSVTHGALIRQIGYHVRDYFLKQMDRFRHIPGGILAHSTHVKGMGTFENGIEIPRVTVTLATSIPESVCREINLGYRDPDSIDPAEWENREEEGILLVRDAGEILYRVRPS